MKPLALLSFLVLLSAPASARSEAAADALERLTEAGRALAGTETISGRFSQTKRFSYLEAPVESSGLFFFARPDFLRWEYLKPVWSRLEVEGPRIEGWTGSPENPLRQSQSLTEAARPAAREIMAWMKLEPQALAAAYETLLLNDSPLTFLVTPRRAAVRRLINSLKVEFSSDRRVVRRVVISEPESETILIFDRILLNQPRP